MQLLSGGKRTPGCFDWTSVVQLVFPSLTYRNPLNSQAQRLPRPQYMSLHLPCGKGWPFWTTHINLTERERANILVGVVLYVLSTAHTLSGQSSTILYLCINFTWVVFKILHCAIQHLRRYKWIAHSASRCTPSEGSFRFISRTAIRAWANVGY